MKAEELKNIELTRGQKTLFYGGAIIVGLAVAAPVLTLAATGAMSLMKLGVCVLILFGAWSLRGLAMMKWKNIVLKMLKAEARKNPVETLQNEYMTFKNGLTEASRRVQPLIATRDGLREKLQEYEDKYHSPDKQLSEMLEKLSEVIDKVKAKINATAEKLPAFRLFVQQQSDRYNGLTNLDTKYVKMRWKN